MHAEIPIEEQSIKPTPAVIVKPPVMFRKAAPAAKPGAALAKPSVPATKGPLPSVKMPGPPTKPSTPIPISAAAASQGPAAMVKSSPAMSQERWDEDSFQGLWDSSEDKGLKSENDLPASDLSLPSSTVATSFGSGIAQLSKPPIIHQTVDYGHGHGHGQGEYCLS